MKHAQLVELYNRLTNISTELFDLSGRADHGYDDFTRDLLVLVNESFEAVERARREAFRLRTVAGPSPVKPVLPPRETYGPDEAPF